MTPVDQPDELTEYQQIRQVLLDLVERLTLNGGLNNAEIAKLHFDAATDRLLERIQTAKAEAYERGVHDGRFNPTRKSELSAEELREYNRLAKQRSRQRSRAQLKAGEKV